ncbi:PEP-CTERM sorting domain-containing protein [Roseateles sp. BYS78W]|uniref:PEP-CTERM sorting domain-containing protein n=1 Tax=Pelomonas candidula TaxID=3299025 RepID=A0ABW7HDR8_9BURK
MKSVFSYLTLACGLLCSVALASAATASLQVGSFAGDTASDVASCLSGAHSGNDLRFCGDNGSVPVAVAGSTASGNSNAAFADGVTTRAWGIAALGTLRAVASTDNPGTSALFRNTQSRAIADMSDVIAVTNSLGASSNTYHYTVVVNGSLSPEVGGGGAFPLARGLVSVDFNTSPFGCPASGCGDAGVIANWDSSSGDPKGSSTVYGGNFTLNVGASFQMRATLDVMSGVNAFAFQPASSTANYGSTVHVYLDAVTPGANTMGVSGFNYATAPVPEPSSFWLWMLGLPGLAAWARRRLPDRR